LRDLTTENELESKKKIEALEKELDLSSDLQGKCRPSLLYNSMPSLTLKAAGDLDNMAVELEESEAKVEELKAQLDAASEAQDMLEELTDRNMKLQDVSESLSPEKRSESDLADSSDI
jgi:dynactin 1